MKILWHWLKCQRIVLACSKLGACWVVLMQQPFRCKPKRWICHTYIPRSWKWKTQSSVRFSCLFVSVLGFISVFAESIKGSVKLPWTWKGRSSHRFIYSKKHVRLHKSTGKYANIQKLGHWNHIYYWFSTDWKILVKWHDTMKRKCSYCKYIKP